MKINNDQEYKIIIRSTLPLVLTSAGCSIHNEMKSFQARALCESKVKQTKKPQPNRTYKACTESLKTIMLLKNNYNKVDPEYIQYE